MTSWQRKSWSGSRPIPFHNPRESQHTAESYGATFRGLRNRNSSFLFRLARMLRREARSGEPAEVAPVEQAKCREERGVILARRRPTSKPERYRTTK